VNTDYRSEIRIVISGLDQRLKQLHRGTGVSGQQKREGAEEEQRECSHNDHLIPKNFGQ